MAEVLSQSQIDALLSAMQDEPHDNTDQKSDQGEQKAYKKYDFYSPKKYTKDKLNLLRGIYDNYARMITSQINGLFRVMSDVEVMGVEEQRYYEFSNALHESDVITLVNVRLSDNSKNPPMVMYIAPQLMTVLIDRMLGGSGMDADVGVSYSYTEIELALYEQIMKYFVGLTGDVWAGYIKLDAEFGRIEKNPTMFQGISVDETIVIVMLKVELLGVSSMMNICIPGTLLFNIFDIIEKTKHLADMEDEEHKRGNREEIQKKIEDSVLEVSAQLAKVTLGMNDIYDLHVGDIINLNKPKDSEVLIRVAGQPWFTGRLGVHNKNIAIKLKNRTDLSGNECSRKEK
ncbi:MAG: flagellar motor switch protein FliM [Clostridiales bacterium]|nr:flagellar motor switch protein FliM [Clostridiales bacterium]